METGTGQETRDSIGLGPLQEAGTGHKIGPAATMLEQGLMALEDDMLSWIHGQGRRDPSASASARALRLWMADLGTIPCTGRTVGQEVTHYVTP